MNASELIKTNLEKVQFRTDITQQVYYQSLKETQVIRGNRRDIVGNPANGIIQIDAFRIYLNPTQKQLDRAGMKEGISAIIWIRQEEFVQKIKTQPDIVRDRIIIRGFEDFRQRNYDIDQQHRTTMLDTGYAFVVLGCIEIL